MRFGRACRYRWIADQVGPAAQGGVLGIAGTKHIERAPALESGDTVEFPSAEDVRPQAMNQVSMAGAEGQFKHVIEHQTVPHVVVRTPTFFVKIEGVSRDIAVTERGIERVRSIIDRMGPGIGSLELDALAHLLREDGLQPVVGCISDRFHNNRLE